MANLYTYVDSLLKPYYKYIIGFIILFLFVLLARFVYRKYFIKQNKNKKFSNVANANNARPIVAIYFFHVDWCPHCVKAQPEWDNFKNQYHNTVINEYLLQCYDINCTDDNGEEVNRKALKLIKRINAESTIKSIENTNNVSFLLLTDHSFISYLRPARFLSSVVAVAELL